MNLEVAWDGQDPADLLTQVGEWLDAQGHGAAALRYYDSALAVQGDHSLAAFGAGDLLARLRRWDEAAAYLDKAVAYSPDHAPTRYLASKVALRCGSESQALHQALRALDLDPNHEGSALVALRSLALMQRWDEIALFCATRPHLCGSAEPQLILALGLCRSGDVPRAQTIWDRTSVRARRRFRDMAAAIEKCLGAPEDGHPGVRA